MPWTARLRAALFSGAVIVAALAGCSTTGAGADSNSSDASAQVFTNPIKEIGNDPWVIKHGRYYYPVESWDGGIWVTRSSKDDLTDIAWAGKRVKVWTPPSDGPACADVWAPELHFIDDHWCIHVAATTCDKDNRNHRMYALRSTTDDALGDYELAGKVTDASDHWAIDDTRFEYRGRAYFAWSGWPGGEDGQQNLYIAEMTSPTTLAGTRVMISQPDRDWERRTQPTEEGPEALVHDGRLFLVYSASASWTDDYCYGMLTLIGDDPLDPDSWSTSDQPMFARTDKVFGPGHGSFTMSPDGSESWMVYHSARRSGAGWNRMMNAQPFRWERDKPGFGAPVATGKSIPVPSGQKTPATTDGS
ncbi:glycoside hydrolase family 43 protein [Galbitalea sp. SE-J8]|uniref:glycoside hydrolase family 43 protein n=1 Tax=Galbitalea sp. SE-J8 TaxID=3054952 RepID=UPI00259CA700|nr:glycoside hydrolase family 43 protein [Galbitalea sp. SE-J8]MDM4761658.1 glycoside hydrolase family 43 protein [Galbitalea sp. SE-J8]